MSAQSRTSNINQNFTRILHGEISREMNPTNRNNNNKSTTSIHMPTMDYNTFISLNKTQFCKYLKEDSDISHGRGVKIYKAIKQTLHRQTDDNHSNNHQLRLDSKLRDQFHWLHINDDQYTSELINETWNEMIKDNDIKQYHHDKEYQSKIALLLFTIFSDKRVAETIDKLTKTDINITDILYTKAIKAMENKDYNQALLYLDEALVFSPNNERNSNEILYKIWIKKSDCFLNMNQYENALHLAQKCMEIKAESIKPHLNSGNALMELQRFDDAKKMFDKAYALAQNNPDSNELLQKEVDISQFITEQKTNSVSSDSLDFSAMECKDIYSAWRKVLDDKNEVIMEFEAAQQHCVEYETCSCLHRVLNTLQIYNAWTIKYPVHWSQSMYVVLKEMKYSDSILNDFFHIKKVHRNDRNLWDYARKYVACNADNSDELLCDIATRNSSNRTQSDDKTKRESLYYGLYDSKDIAVLQMLDAMHSYFIHHDNDKKSNKYVTKVVDDDELKSLQIGTFLDKPSETKKNEDAKYRTLKEELLSNTIYPLTNYQWCDIYLRCTQLRNTLHAKQTWSAHDNGLLNISSGVTAGSHIEMNQLISLFLALNYENVCTLFTDSAFRKAKDESLSQLKRRHSEIAIWSSKLRQSVWFFGSFCGSDDVFYHGFNQKILFRQYHVTVELPLFVTRDLSLLSYDDDDDGIVFKLSQDTGSAIGYPYFSTSFVSDFNDTKDAEAIFFHCQLKLNDIMHNNQWYTDYLESLLWFEKITSGYYFDYDAKSQNYIIKMMQKRIKNDSNTSCSLVPLYAQELFECFCDSKVGNIWLLPSELKKLSDEFKKLLLEISHGTEMKFVYEFKWEISGDSLLQFHTLQLEQAMIGPICCCKMVDEEEDDDVMNNVDECAVFIPYCKKSTSRKEDFGEFGLILQKLPANVTSVLFEYEVYCQEAAYSLCVPPQKWMCAGDNIAFTSFKTDTIHNMPSFSYCIALKIKQTQREKV